MDGYRRLILVIAVPTDFYFISRVWITMPYYVAITGVAISTATIIVVILSYLFQHRLFGSKPEPLDRLTIPDYAQINYSKEPEPNNYPPEWNSIFFVILCLMSFAAMGLIVIKIPVHLDPKWIGFFLFTGFLPLVITVDTLILEPKQNRLGKSRVATPKTIRLSSNIQTVFNKCLKVLDMMNTTRIMVERPKLIKVWQRDRRRGNHVIIVNLSRKRGKEMETEIKIVSDSQWTTTKWDFLHTNRKNVDTFERLIHSEIGHV